MKIESDDVGGEDKGGVEDDGWRVGQSLEDGDWRGGRTRRTATRLGRQRFTVGQVLFGLIRRGRERK